MALEYLWSGRRRSVPMDSDRNPTNIEIWKPINGCDGLYEASNMGRIRSCIPGTFPKIISSNPKYVYKTVSILRFGKRITRRIHRLVLETFCGIAPDGYESAHLNGNKHDNRLVNLKWATHKENVFHKKLHGTEKLGEKHRCAKIFSFDIKTIRMKYSKIPTRILARYYGVHTRTICDIALKNTWRHI